MKNLYTKKELLKLEDRFENIFSLPFESDKVANQVIEYHNCKTKEIKKSLLNKNYTLILSIPRFPVHKILKKGQVIIENESFKLLEITNDIYNKEIEEFLVENEYSLNYFWAKNVNNIEFIISKTSQERIKITNIFENEIYHLRDEVQECIISSWH